MILEFDPVDSDDLPLIVSGKSESIILEFPGNDPDSFLLPVYGPGRSEQAGFILFDVE